MTHVPLVVDEFDEIEEWSLLPAGLSATLVAQAGGETETLYGVDLRSERREGAISQRDPEDFEVYLDRNPEFDTSCYHRSLLIGYQTLEYWFQTSDDRSKLFVPPDQETDVSEVYSEIAADFEPRSASG